MNINNSVTIGTTYYNNPDYLEKFVKRNLPYVNELIVVDDGSSDLVTNYLSPNEKIRIFRVKKDYGFNSHGCRNLIMKMSSNEWNILMDVDREFVFPEVAYERILTTRLKDNVRYRFMAHSKNIYSDSHFSVNDFLISKKHFFSAGGYDEEIIGQRWGDREYFSQLLNFGYEKVLFDVDMLLTRKPSVRIGAESPNDIKPDRDHKELVKSRIKSPQPDKPILTFEWEELK